MSAVEKKEENNEKKATADNNNGVPKKWREKNKNAARFRSASADRKCHVQKKMQEKAVSALPSPFHHAFSSRQSFNKAINKKVRVTSSKSTEKEVRLKSVLTGD